MVYQIAPNYKILFATQFAAQPSGWPHFSNWPSKRAGQDEPNSSPTAGRDRNSFSSTFFADDQVKHLRSAVVIVCCAHIHDTFWFKVNAKALFNLESDIDNVHSHEISLSLHSDYINQANYLFQNPSLARFEVARPAGDRREKAENWPQKIAKHAKEVFATRGTTRILSGTSARA